MSNAKRDDTLSYEERDASVVRRTIGVTAPVPIARIRTLVDLAERVSAPPRVYAHLCEILSDPRHGEPGSAAPSNDVDRELEVRFWRNVLEEPSLRDLATEGPRAASRGAGGTLELVATVAKTVRESLAALADFSEIAYGVPVFSIAARDDGSVAVLYESPLPREQPAAQIAAELALSSVMELVRRNVGDPLASARALHLRGLPVAGTTALARAMRCEVQLGAASDRLEIPPSLASLELGTSAPLIHGAALRLARLERDALFRGRAAPAVRCALRDLVSSRAAHDDGDLLSVAVAAVLETRPRTMQARLTAEGVPFRALVDEARRVAVERLLVEGRGPSRIQAELGYGDSASLRRACRRWWGVGPSVRARALG